MDMVFLYDSRFAKAMLLEAFRDSVLATRPVTGCSILMRWGNISGSDNDAGIVLNRKKPLINCLDKEKSFEILRLNKVRRPHFILPKPDSRYPVIGKRFDPVTRQQHEKTVTDFQEAQHSGSDFFVECVNTVKKYNVYIFDLNIFYMTKKIVLKTHTGTNGAIPSWNYEEIPPDLDQDAQKVGLLALRASYVLGLDFCEVHAGIDVHGRAVVLDVSPVPALPLPAVSLFRKQVSDFVYLWHQTAVQKLRARANSEPEPVVPGFDQTTLFTGHDQPGDSSPRPGAVPSPATDGEPDVLLGADPEFMLRNTVTGQISYPSDYLPKDGRLGYDDRSERRQGILFPLAEIRPDPDYCPLRLTEKIRSILAQALSVLPPHIEWLAGSLHFENYQIGGHIHFSNININARLMRALDNYLGIPVMLIEDPATASRRRKQYGWLGSVRCKPHGGFEYRTPASWLVTPEITRGCLCLAKIVAVEYSKLPRDFLSNPDIQKAFYQSKKYYFYDMFNVLWHDIMKTTLYPQYARHLVPITELIRSHLHWNETVDLRKSWGLLPTEGGETIT